MSKKLVAFFSAPGAEFVAEKRLTANVSEAELKSWIDSLGV